MQRRASLSSIPNKKCSIGVSILLCVNSFDPLSFSLFPLLKISPGGLSEGVGWIFSPYRLRFQVFLTSKIKRDTQKTFISQVSLYWDCV